MRDLAKYTLKIFFLTHSSHQYLSIDDIMGRNNGPGQVFSIGWVAAFLLHHFLVAVLKSTVTLCHNYKCFKDDIFKSTFLPRISGHFSARITSPSLGVK